MKLCIAFILISISTFSQVPGFKLPKPSAPKGDMSSFRPHYLAEKIVTINSTTLRLKNIYYEMPSTRQQFGILRKNKKRICSFYGLGKFIKGSMTLAKRDIPVLKEGFYVPSPNRVIKDIDCIKNYE
jgi:hypothetical protein